MHFFFLQNDHLDGLFMNYKTIAIFFSRKKRT